MLVSDDAITEPASAEMDAFLELLAVAPTTLGGVVALVTYLDEVNKAILGTPRTTTQLR
jgi:hypothetical protein